MSQAVTPDLTQTISTAVGSDTDRLVAIFKDIHRDPELGFMETRTAGIVANELEALGFDVTTSWCHRRDGCHVKRRRLYGNVPRRYGRQRGGGGDRPDCASTVRVKRSDGAEAPVAHMCGHDAHVTWMLSTARIMTENKESWGGTLVLIASLLRSSSAARRRWSMTGYTQYDAPVPDHFVALHTAPVPTGVVAARAGTTMAGTDQVDVTFHGIGGHGSTPQLAKDPVVTAASAVTQYQLIVSRVVPPLETAVLTVGSIQAGTDNNVIPDEALVKINLRFFTPQTRETMISGIRSINNGIARTYGMSDDRMPDMVMKGYSPPLVNDAPLIERLEEPLAELLGEENVMREFPPATGSEDAHILPSPHENAEVAYMAVGIADPDVFAEARARGQAVPFAAHNPNFIVDLDAIPLGTEVAAVLVLELMAK